MLKRTEYVYAKCCQGHKYISRTLVLENYSDRTLILIYKVICKSV